MAKPRRSWQALPHEPLQKLAENLRWVRAPVPGLTLRRTMTVARLTDGQLVIFNAVALDEPSMRELEAWGTPAFLIVPGAGHRLDAAAYKARYPALKIYAPAGAQRAVEQVVSLDGLLQDFPNQGSVELRAVAGIKDKEGVMLVRSSDGVTIVVSDILFNMAVPPGLFGALVKLIGSAPGPRVSRIVKAFYCDDKAAFRESLRKLSELPDLARLIVAHDTVAHGADARAALISAVNQLS
jgi:hypothetical protein